MKDKLSALLDGDLDEHAMRPVMEGLRRDPELRKDWDTYCLIGDALRGEQGGSADFANRVMAGLEDEPTLLAPVQTVAAGRQRVWQSLMPIAASVMGVAAVGLVAATLYSEDAPAPARMTAQNLAVQTFVPSPSSADRSGLQLVSNDPHREYVFAHQGMSSFGPVPAGLQYVRTVSDQRQGAGR